MGMVETAKELMALGANVNEGVPEKGWLPLQYTAHHGITGLTAKFIEYGANING